MQDFQVKASSGPGGHVRQVTGYQLKWVAVLTMATDHVGASLLEYALRYGYGGSALRAADFALRRIGRLAFPLFIFLLAEGFHYTRSRRAYLVRLGLFSLLSDIPFDLALYLQDRQVRSGTFFTLQQQNVFFTLFFGFLGMYLLDAAIKRFYESRRGLCVCLCILACALGYGAAQLCRTDYGGAGVAAIILAYFLRKTGRPDLEMLGIVAALGILSSWFEWAALADVLLVSFYHGREGRKGSRWFFYLFYPCHLLLLFLIRIVFVPF